VTLGEAEAIHQVLRAAFIDGTPEALAQVHPAAVQLVERTWRALSGSGRPYVTLSAITAARPGETGAASPAEPEGERREPARR
jgi:hypothetical protein